MRKYIILSALYVFSFPSLNAQNVVEVEAHACFIASATMSPKEARYQTILKAQTDAIAKTFGSIVSDENMSFVREKDHTSTSDFFSLHEGDVRGVWLETIGDPIWSEPKHLSDGGVVYETRLKGKIMELENAPIDIQTKLLFNGKDPDKDEIRNFTFYQGDTLFLYFRTPVDGYLAVYVVDYEDNMNTQCLLPDSKNPDGIQRVESNTDYIFFSKENHKGPMIRMISKTAHDYNQFYVIFSPNPFTKANDRAIDKKLPPYVSFNDFQKWLSNIRRSKSHSQMCVEKIFVDIINNKQVTNSVVSAVGPDNPLSDRTFAQQPVSLNSKQQKELKTLLREGWKPTEYGDDLEKMYATWYQMETEKQANGTDKYIIQFSEVEDNNLQIALRRACDDAIAVIRGRENVHIQSSLKTVESSSNNNDKAESHSDVIMTQRSKTKYAGTTNDIVKVMSIYKKVKTGYIVRMVVAKEIK
ncbi:MAG: hypothetical protein J6W03_07425 [Bacteroidaceae bacterium]|nr:hypothetical protein [Bacteroidaceae bacterium]